MSDNENEQVAVAEEEAKVDSINDAIKSVI